MNEEWCVGYEEGKMDALKEIDAAIEAAVLAEREACAKVCEQGTAYIQFQSNDCYSYAHNRAAAIRGLK